jgi:hypothetical protein
MVKLNEWKRKYYWKMRYTGYHEKEGKGGDLCVSGKRILNPFQKMRFGNWTLKMAKP